MTWSIPHPLRTVHFIGDTHVADTGGATIFSPTRRDIFVRDAISERVPHPLAHVQVGDVVNENTDTDVNDAENDTAAIEFLDRLTDGTGAPWFAACGNHDIWDNNRDADDWAAAFGYADQNYVEDFEDALTPFRLIVVGPDDMPVGDTTRIELSAATLAWLDARLGETQLPCLIVGHAPLKGTVLTARAGDPDSNDAGFFICSEADTASSDDVKDVLAAHTNSKAWISGHIHIDAFNYSAEYAQDIVKAEDVGGGHIVAAVNCPAPAYSGASVENYDAMHGTYVSLYGDRLEVRFRNHSGRCWDLPFAAALDAANFPSLVHTVEYE